MSDAQLRELDRRWRREASAELFCELAAACARAGVRAPPAGEADVWGPRRLALGARLGDPDARRALGLPGWTEPDDPSAWVGSLEEWDESYAWSPWAYELYARISAAAARAAAHLCPDPRPERALAALERWITAGAVFAAGSEVRSLTSGLGTLDTELVRALARPGNDSWLRDQRSVVSAVGAACGVVVTTSPNKGCPRNAAHHAGLVVGVPTVVAAVRREVIPWVLFSRG